MSDDLDDTVANIKFWFVVVVLVMAVGFKLCTH